MQVATVAKPSGKNPELRRTGEHGQFANSRERLICDFMGLPSGFTLQSGISRIFK